MYLKIDILFDNSTKQVEIIGENNQLSQLQNLIQNMSLQTTIEILPAKNKSLSHYSLVTQLVIIQSTSPVMKIIIRDETLVIYLDAYWKNWFCGILETLRNATQHNQKPSHQHIEAFKDDEAFLYHISPDSWHLIIMALPDEL